MTTTLKQLGAGVLVLGLIACGQKAEDEFAAATPDVDGLVLELAGGASEGLAASPATTLAAAPADVVPPSIGGGELAGARDAIAALNGEVRRILEQVAAVVRTEGAPEVGDAKTYGPVVRCVQQGDAGCVAEASLRLRVQRLASRTWTWTLGARDVAAAADAPFLPVMAGWMHRNAEAHRGRGKVAFNLENLAAAAPGYTGRGYLLAGFGHAGRSKTLVYRLLGFTPDATARPPVTATFYGHRTPSGVSRVRVAAFADVVDGANLEFPRELVLSRIGWVPGVGGRGHVVVSNWLDQADPANLHGDVPFVTVGTDHYFLGRACWGADGALKVKEWRWCPRPAIAAAGAGACLATDPIAVEPAGATWQTSCTGFQGEEPVPGDVSVGAEHGGGAEPAVGQDAPPEPMAPPFDPTDVQPTATL